MSNSSGVVQDLWANVEVRLDLLPGIISSHFKQPCDEGSVLSEGSYARCHLYTLEDGKRIVARMILPAREYVKTESEVASMFLLRGELSILTLRAALRILRTHIHPYTQGISIL